MEAVRFDNVKYSYREDGENYAVNGVTLSIEEGELSPCSAATAAASPPSPR